MHHKKGHRSKSKKYYRDNFCFISNWVTNLFIQSIIYCYSYPPSYFPIVFSHGRREARYLVGSFLPGPQRAPQGGSCLRYTWADSLTPLVAPNKSSPFIHRFHSKLSANVFTPNVTPTENVFSEINNFLHIIFALFNSLAI